LFGNKNMWLFTYVQSSVSTINLTTYRTDFTGGSIYQVLQAKRRLQQPSWRITWYSWSPIEEAPSCGLRRW